MFLSFFGQFILCGMRCPGLTWNFLCVVLESVIASASSLQVKDETLGCGHFLSFLGATESLGRQPIEGEGTQSPELDWTHIGCGALDNSYFLGNQFFHL